MADETVQDILAHYGVKGMKWGVRKNRSTNSQEVTVRARPGSRVRARGGQRQSPSEDAVRAAVSRQKAKRSTLDSLSNKELEELVRRMNLEQQYKRLSSKSLGKSFASKILTDLGQREVTKLLSSGVDSVLKR